MKINGWWLACGLLGLIDYADSISRIGYNFTVIQFITVILIFVGFGFAFSEVSE